MLHSGVRSEQDAALALLSEHLESKSVPLKTSAIIGLVLLFAPLFLSNPPRHRLGLAYAGSHREDLMLALLPIVSDDVVSMEVAALAALALGFIFSGSANGEIAGTVLQTIMDRMEPDDSALGDKWARFLILGLALLYLGQSRSCISAPGVLVDICCRAPGHLGCYYRNLESHSPPSLQTGGYPRRNLLICRDK